LCFQAILQNRYVSISCAEYRGEHLSENRGIPSDVFRITATGADPVPVERPVFLFDPFAEGMLCPADLGAAPQTGPDLPAVVLVFITPVAEDMFALTALPVVTSRAFLALDAGVLISIMPL